MPITMCSVKVLDEIDEWFEGIDEDMTLDELRKYLDETREHFSIEIPRIIDDYLLDEDGCVYQST